MEDYQYRMLANPYRLTKDKQTPLVKKQSSFKSELEKLIEHEYQDIYINPVIYNTIHSYIITTLQDYICDVVSTETTDSILESTIQDVLRTEDTNLF